MSRFAYELLLFAFLFARQGIQKRASTFGCIKGKAQGLVFFVVTSVSPPYLLYVFSAVFSVPSVLCFLKMFCNFTISKN